MEVDVSDAEELGFNGLLRLLTDDIDVTVASATDSETIQALTNAAASGAAAGATGGASQAIGPFLASFLRNTTNPDADGNPTENGSIIRGILRAAASDGGTNILSAPHILTSDNEEAEIRVGDNIPIISSRVEAATGAPTVSTSVNVERQDIGVTLRVTPQITEGDTLRLDIYQEITAVNSGLQASVGDVNSVGPALSNRRVENTVVVANGETVVIGGLLGDDYQDTVVKVPWLGDIPFFGWLFKTTTRNLRKLNLLVFLTPHIVRAEEDLELQTIRKREEFRKHAARGLELSEREVAWERKQMKEAAAKGETYEPGRGINPARHALLDHEKRYPLERMVEIERMQREEAEQRALEAQKPQPEYFLQAGLFTDETEAVDTLTTLVDLGYDGTLVTGQRAGRVLYEVRVGPYADLDEAQAAIRVLERSTGLAPTILIETPEELEKQEEKTP
jgi:Flp pilus assembly secretin CpaC